VSNRRWLVGGAALTVIAAAVLAASVGGQRSYTRVLSSAQAPPLSKAKDIDGETAAAPGAAENAAPSDPVPQATAAYARGDYGAALLGFERAMTEHPEDARAINNVGQVLVRLGRAPEAIPLFEKAVANSPNEWSYRFNLARARSQVHDWPGAVADYREADRLLPDDGPTLFNLGLSLQQTGADAEAAQVLEKAVAQSPDDASFVLALARSYQRLSRAPEARTAFERYLALAPQSADAAAARQALAALAGPQPPPGQPRGVPPAQDGSSPTPPPS
jgi:tetratricopeptide (TPR) repeat protein